MVDWIERNRGYIIVVAINLAVVGALHFWSQYPTSGAIEIVPAPSPTHAADPAATVSLLRVHVAGAVLRPDVYHLPAGSIVRDAVQAAGGATEDADLARINLALELHDQQQVHVPRAGEEGTLPAARADQAVFPSARLNINTATVEELDQLPGIGPGLAQRIVDWREANGPFASIADIKQVAGIGEAIFERIKDRIVVGE